MATNFERCFGRPSANPRRTCGQVIACYGRQGYCWLRTHIQTYIRICYMYVHVTPTKDVNLSSLGSRSRTSCGGCNIPSALHQGAHGWVGADLVTDKNMSESDLALLVLCTQELLRYTQLCLSEWEEPGSLTTNPLKWHGIPVGSMALFTCWHDIVVYKYSKREGGSCNTWP